MSPPTRERPRVRILRSNVLNTFNTFNLMHRVNGILWRLCQTFMKGVLSNIHITV